MASLVAVRHLPDMLAVLRSKLDILRTLMNGR